MSEENSKEKGCETGSADFDGFPEHFSWMFKKMSECFGSGEKASACFEKMRGMMETCCGSESGKGSKGTCG
jgi:hypothetical protein